MHTSSGAVRTLLDILVAPFWKDQPTRGVAAATLELMTLAGSESLALFKLHQGYLALQSWRERRRSRVGLWWHW
jgi:hypothetical protein